MVPSGNSQEPVRATSLSSLCSRCRMPRLQKRSAPTVAIWSFRAQFKESCTDRLAQEFRKVFDVFFRRVERAHPAHNRLLFIPDIKEVTLLKFTDGVLRDLGEDSVSFHFRSEEHTSELQSHSDLVCRLLLEKK